MPGQLAAAASQRLANELVDLGAPKPRGQVWAPLKLMTRGLRDQQHGVGAVARIKPYLPLARADGPLG
jgi:hypothetical protein